MINIGAVSLARQFVLPNVSTELHARLFLISHISLTIDKRRERHHLLSREGKTLEFIFGINLTQLLVQHREGNSVSSNSDGAETVSRTTI
jgi:hypothetical protein